MAHVVQTLLHDSASLGIRFVNGKGNGISVAVTSIGSAFDMNIRPTFQCPQLGKLEI